MTVEEVPRRQAMRTLAVAGASILAGCSASDGGDGTPTSNGSGTAGGGGRGGETGGGSGTSGPPTGEGWRTVGQDGGRTYATAGEGPIEDLAVTTLFDREAAELEPTAAPIAGDDGLYCWTDAGVYTNLTRVSLEGEVEWSVQDGGQSLALESDRLAYTSAGMLVTRDPENGDVGSESELAHFDNTAGPTVRDGVVFYGWNDQEGGEEPPYVTAVDVATGDERWRT